VQETFGCTIVQVYGAMDAGGMTIHSCSDADEVRLSTIGRPATGNEIKLVDDEGRVGRRWKWGKYWPKGRPW